MAGYGAKEARINRERQTRVNLCGSCGEEIDQNELLCKECRVPTVGGEDETNHETRRGK
jgi:predicted amidophosphoribosyltransferase